MRFTDVFLSFPMILAIVIAAFWGGGLHKAVIALAVSWWPFYARMVRGSAVSVRERPYVRAAESIGASRRSASFGTFCRARSARPDWRRLARYGTYSPLAALSFLGVGAQPPTPEWGLMITQSRTYFMKAWWYMAFPGIAITLTVLAFNLLGDGLERSSTPRQGAEA